MQINHPARRGILENYLLIFASWRIVQSNQHTKTSHFYLVHSFIFMRIKLGFLTKAILCWWDKTMSNCMFCRSPCWHWTMFIRSDASLEMVSQHVTWVVHYVWRRRAIKGTEAATIEYSISVSREEQTLTLESKYCSIIIVFSGTFMKKIYSCFRIYLMIEANFDVFPCAAGCLSTSLSSCMTMKNLSAWCAVISTPAASASRGSSTAATLFAPPASRSCPSCKALSAPSRVRCAAGSPALAPASPCPVHCGLTRLSGTR